MYAFENKNILHEISCGNNFAYILNDNVNFVSIDYKVLQSQTMGIFIRCLKMHYNGKVQLYYMTDGYRAMSEMMTEMTPDFLVNVAVNLLGNLIEVESNGFLCIRNIELSWTKIFVDPVTLNVKFVYLPIDIKLFDSDMEFENRLRSNIVQFIQKYFLVKNERMKRFLSDISNRGMSIRQVYSKYTAIKEKKQEDLCRKEKDRPLQMRALNAPEPFEILLKADSILLGSRREFADVEIAFNKRISRKHCRVIHNSKGYFIVDEESKNGTFINNKRLVPHQPEALQRGAIVRLADSVFQIL